VARIRLGLWGRVIDGFPARKIDQTLQSRVNTIQLAVTTHLRFSARRPMPPPRPFPFPSLSIGTDIAHIPRIAKLVASQRKLPRFLRKVLTSREERDFHLRFPQKVSKGAEGGSGFSEGEQKSVQRIDEAAAARFLAGRWAAKEAVVKACAWRKLTFDEIQIRKDAGSRRVYGVVLDKPEVRKAMRQMKNGEDARSGDTASQEHTVEGEEEAPAGQIVKISISHDGEYATAVCLAAEGDGAACGS
jgi:holo-[acyl-carrier protein] synthase